MIVFHDDPFTPSDRQPERVQSSGENPGTHSLSARVQLASIPDDWVPQSSHAGKLRVGARPLEVGQWVSTRDVDWGRTLSMKRDLLAQRPTEVAAFLPGVDEACDEVAAGVLASVGEMPSTESGVDALIDAASRVADDLCIIQLDAHGVPILAGAVVCSPNRWLLREKIGGSMSAIHDPVARYDIDLDSPVNAMMARLTTDRPVWRINWGVANHPALFQPVPPPVTSEMPVGQMWLRIEWQTLRRLPVTGAVLFTIRTYLQQLSDFMNRDYAVVHDFADVIAKIPESVAEYKGIAPYRDALYDYLSTR